MEDLFATKQKLIEQISSFKQRIQNLEQSESEHRLAAQGLLNSRNMLQTVLDSIPSAVFWKDRNSRYLGGNRIWLKAIGIKSSEEVIGKSDYDLLWEKEQADSFRRYDKRVMESGTPECDIIEPYLRADGTPAWAKTSKVPLRDTKGNVVGILGSFEDITDRKRAEEEIAVLAEIGRVIGSSLEIDEVYERFAAEARKLIPFDRITVNLTNIRENIVTVAYVSGAGPSSYKQGETFPLTGTLIEEVLRKRIGLIVQSEEMAEVVSRIPRVSRLFQSGLRSLIDVPLIFTDEAIGVLHFWSKIPNAFTEQDLRLAERIGNQIAGAIANAQLFSDLKKTDLSLRESEGRFRALVEEAPVGVAEVEVGTGRFFTVNRRLSEIVDRTKEELLAATFRTITHPEDLHLHEEKKALLIAGKIGYYSLEKRYLRKDGGIVWVNLTVSPLWKPGETPRRHITVIEDITERKLAEEELHRAHAELQVKNITLQELNTTLKVLLKQREDDKRDMEERFVMNVKNLVLPFVEQMKRGRLDVGQQPCLDIIETHLHDIATPLLKNIRHFNLTPRELKVAALVRNGKTTKEIAEILSVATGSIDIHRINIRKKLGLSSRRTNLQSYLEILVQ